MTALEKAEKEMVRGNLWRAKEILQGSIPNAGYNCDVFEKLGTVLLTMGDLPEAGRFLFLAGRRKPEYEQAINIFLRKHDKSWRVLFQTFPRAAKLSRLSDYPNTVRGHLAQLGFPQILRTDPLIGPGHSGSVMSNIAVWLIVGSILAVILLGIFKLIEIIRWIL